MNGSSHQAWTPSWRLLRTWLTRPGISPLPRSSSTSTVSRCSLRWWKVGLSKWEEDCFFCCLDLPCLHRFPLQHLFCLCMCVIGSKEEYTLPMFSSGFWIYVAILDFDSRMWSIKTSKHRLQFDGIPNSNLTIFNFTYRWHYFSQAWCNEPQICNKTPALFKRAAGLDGIQVDLRFQWE